ncbi:Golgi apparatus protein 1-like isoform X1 [Asterias amurensis]|uniref:Golgi apparatus protein 1-like isoform X1 n=1 Tax=Asterias amurensis TaxID=7602 RepID=UPI003AB851E9
MATNLRVPVLAACFALCISLVTSDAIKQQLDQRRGDVGGDGGQQRNFQQPLGAGLQKVGDGAAVGIGGGRDPGLPQQRGVGAEAELQQQLRIQAPHANFKQQQPPQQWRNPPNPQQMNAGLQDSRRFISNNNVQQPVAPGLQQRGQEGGQQGQPFQQPRAPKPPKSPRGGPGKPIRIADQPACQQEVAAFCSKNIRGNNFVVLDCLQNANENRKRAAIKDNTEFGDSCNRFLWDYKMNLTMDVRFDSAAFEVCKTEITKFPDCAALERGKGLVLPCLYDVYENITSVQCRQYVNRMKTITFSDFRLIHGFFMECKEDIIDKKCGVVNDNHLAVKNAPAVPHSQGATINCLESKLKDLQGECKKQILRVAELTADDYHSDRALFFACREDRERFCATEAAGQGQIYKCLLKHKFKEDMSEGCRNKLTVRQTVVNEDFKANYRLARKCREDMKKTQCMSPRDKQNRELRLSKLLICLEIAKHKGAKLSGDCVAEVEDTRKSLMDDFMVNPEVILNCRSEIASHCDGGLQREGKTLHCLMKLAKQQGGKETGSMSRKCEKALQDLVEEADAGANYRIDSALHKACKPVRDKLCKTEDAGDAKVLSCLMENIYSSEMTKECETQLLELQYFVSRDFKLDPLLYKNCQQDATNLCYEENWQNSQLPQGVVFACLHRHLHPQPDEIALSTGCQAQVHRVLRQRAVSIHLNPQIEAKCRADLGQYCADKTGKGEELNCLQDNVEKLQDDCRKMIGNFTVEEAEDIKMNRKLMAACAPMIKKFCKDFLSKKVDEGAALQCLIDHKNDEEMDQKCAIGIEHFQLIQLQDYRFNFKFKEACRKDVVQLCKKSKDKSSIIKCLSSQVRDDTLMEKEQSVSIECRKQLKAELLQRSEDIHLDPELFKGCERDVPKFCSNIKAGNARILECLRDHRKELEEQCHIKLFNRQKEQALNVQTDYTFVHSCKRMIKLYCSGLPQDELLKCLKTHRNEQSFDSNCKAVLTKRSIQKLEDFRLNPLLQKACRRDMPKFCGSIQEKAKEERYKNKELEGEMVECLKMKFSTKNLSPDCENYVRDLIHEAAMDYRMDPVLSRICKTTTVKYCSEQLESPGQGQVEECLKSKLHEGKIDDLKCRMQVIRLVQQGRADVHVDPLLYKACALDIKHFCAGIPQGQGRQMSCLIEALDDSTIKLHPDCQRMISERKEMWSYSVKVAPPGSLQDLAAAINSSESRGYFLMVFLAIIGILFFGGMCCGRATKRIRAELKNK